jgi:predicted O-methyltransferase YrrM
MDRIDSVLSAIEEEVEKGPRFLPIVGPEKGKFYYLMAKAGCAKKVLELGTLIGYSALLFSKAVGKEGKIVTVEIDDASAEEAKANFEKAGVRNIRQVRGDARKAVKDLIAKKQRFDLIFIDIEKDQYVGIFEDCLNLLPKGGMILYDNALWDTNVLKKFRSSILSNKKADSIMIPISDGISMSVKR